MFLNISQINKTGISSVDKHAEIDPFNQMDGANNQQSNQQQKRKIPVAELYTSGHWYLENHVVGHDLLHGNTYCGHITWISKYRLAFTI